MSAIPPKDPAGCEQRRKGYGVTLAPNVGPFGARMDRDTGFYSTGSPQVRYSEECVDGKHPAGVIGPVADPEGRRSVRSGPESWPVTPGGRPQTESPQDPSTIDAWSQVTLARGGRPQLGWGHRDELLESMARELAELRKEVESYRNQPEPTGTNRIRTGADPSILEASGYCLVTPVSYTHLTLPTIYSV